MNTNTELNPNGLAEARYEMAKSTVRGDKLENAIKAYLPHHNKDNTLALNERNKDGLVELIPEMAELLDMYRFTNFEGRESLGAKELEISNRVDEVLLKHDKILFPEIFGKLTNQKQRD